MTETSVEEEVTWQGHGLVRVGPGFLTGERFTALAAEGKAAIGRSEPYEREETAGHRDGSFAAPAHCLMAAAGPELQSLLYDKNFLLVLRRLTGMERLVPFGAVYVTYRQGDFQGLHTDDLKSTLTMGIALTPNLGPMRWAPSLRAAAPDLLGQVVAKHGIFPDDAEVFPELAHPYGPGGMQGWAGYDIPHYRPPHTGGEPAQMATLSYLDL